MEEQSAQPTVSTSTSAAPMTAAWREQRRKLKEEKKLLKKQLKVAQIEAGKEDLRKFAEAYLTTDGNATEAAMKAFGYGVEQYGAAAVRAHDCLRRIKRDPAILALMEKKGLSLGKFIDVLGKKIDESKTPEWWDRGMALRGERDFMQKGGPQVGIVNIVEAQKKILSEYGEEVVEEGEVVVDD